MTMSSLRMQAEHPKNNERQLRDDFDLSLKIDDATILEEGKLLDVIIHSELKESHLLLNITSKDRLGVIERLTNIVSEEGANIIYSRGGLTIPLMQRLNGTIPEEDPTAMLIRRLESTRLHHSVFAIIGNIDSMRRIWNRLGEIKDLKRYLPRSGEYDTCIVSGFGEDAIGILQNVCETLYEMRINVSEFVSQAHLSLESRSKATLKMTLELPRDRSWELSELEHALRERLRLKLKRDWHFALQTDLSSQLIGDLADLCKC